MQLTFKYAVKYCACKSFIRGRFLDTVREKFIMRILRIVEIN